MGSGPGGCVVASRLSENPHINVLLLEAGGRPSTLHTVPALAGYADIPGKNWGYRVNPYPGSCLAFEGQQCRFPLGKMLGGSSSLNYLIYARGSSYDYDRWEQMGNYGWGFKDVVPLFERLENATGVTTGSGAFRGNSGPLSIQHAPYRTAIVEKFRVANEELGLQQVDYNGPRPIGYDYFQATTRNGRRLTAAQAYLAPIEERKNLHVMLNSLVSRVVIDPGTRTATGVEFIHQNETYRVSSRKEVILSAGPVNSPQLLMLSGIGPKEDLMRLSIPVLADLPVGQNFRDHVVSPGLVFLVNTTGENINLMDIDQKDIEWFVKEGRGKLTTPASIEGVAFVNSGVDDVPKAFPNVELVFSPGKNEVGSSDHPGIRKEIYDTVFKPIEDPSIEVYAITAVDLYPVAQGTIKLRGNSVLNPPIIDIPYLANPRDIEALLAGLKQILAISETQAMRSINATLHSIPYPECAHLPFASDPYFVCLMRQHSRNLCHIASSNKMGPRSDRNSVVDPELRVHGISNLRVADSSIAPTSIAGHTQAVAYLVGEKMADILKRQWNI